MTVASIVRKATPEDKPQILHLLEMMHQENGLFSMNSVKVESLVDRTLYPELIDKDDPNFRGMAGVIGDSTLEGIILLILGTTWYSDQITLEDAANFVHPDHRKSEHAKSLISYAKMITDSVRIDNPDFRLMLGVVSNKRTEAKIRLYKRQLGEPVGGFFFYPRPIENEFRGLK